MPQILKEEIKKRILDSALESFVIHGYKDTSMKSIAKHSGIAVGNIYNYFKDKESLYDTLALPVFEQINGLFKEPLADPTSISVDMRMHSFISIYNKNKKIFVMLLENSNNTKFETLKNIVIDNFAFAIKRNRISATSIPNTKSEDLFIRAFTGAYINGIIIILSKRMDEEKKLEVLYQFLSFMKNALMSKYNYTKEVNNEKTNL